MLAPIIEVTVVTSHGLYQSLVTDFHELATVVEVTEFAIVLVVYAQLLC